MELKTLKDIEEGRCEECDYEYGHHKSDYTYSKLIREKELKQEAIKWIRHRRDNCIFSCRERKMVCNEHRFWMERFNITEEDLK